MYSNVSPHASSGNFLTRPLTLGVILAAVVLVLYWPATNSEFSHFDDLTYYVDNQQVQSGMGWNGLVWAFTTGTASNWHPLTWLSLMMDADLGNGAKDATTPHFTNILLHGVDSALLFAVLWQATRKKWPSLLVAALFATHPLNVESVAWVAERKNVLCMFFTLLSLLVYVKAVKQISGKAEREIRKGGKLIVDGQTTNLKSSCYFYVSIIFFALALMSKPMAVTLPFLLLLLDYWPLNRSGNWKRLAVEKWTFFALSAASCVVTFLVQQQGKAVQTVEHFPVSGRLENVFVSYARYLEKTFWPANLAIYYPHPGHWPATEWILSATLVVSLTLGALWWGRKTPCFAVGWFWFLGTLVPVIGLVQVGSQSMADRYAYLPLIGIFIALVWGGHEVFEQLKLPMVARGLAGGIILLATAATAHHQLSFWQNDGTLFGHALAVTERNSQAEVTYGVYLEKIQQPEEAIKHYRQALAIDPNEKNAHFNLANLLDDAGKTDDAINEYRAALRVDPSFYPAAYNLALVLERLGRRDEAIAEYKAALQSKPDFAPAKQHLQGLGVAVGP